MVELTLRDDALVVEVLGWHRLWALRRRVEVPIAAIRAVRRLPPDAIDAWWLGWRVPGTHLPGVIVAGTFYRGGERHFWDVSAPARGLELELDGARYDRLFVEVADPDAALAALAARGITPAP